MSFDNVLQQKGFVFETRFIIFFDTTNNYILQVTISCTYKHTSVHSHVFTAVAW
jgi:hypothetical protein